MTTGKQSGKSATARVLINPSTGVSVVERHGVRLVAGEAQDVDSATAKRLCADVENGQSLVIRVPDAPNPQEQAS